MASFRSGDRGAGTRARGGARIARGGSTNPVLEILKGVPLHARAERLSAAGYDDENIKRMLSNQELYEGQTVDIRRVSPSVLSVIGDTLLRAKRIGVSLGQLCNPPPSLDLSKLTRLDVFDDRVESLQGRGKPDAFKQKLPPLPALKAVTVIAAGEPHGGFDVAQAVLAAATPELQVLAVKRRGNFGHYWYCDAADAFFSAKDAGGEYLADRIRVLHADIQHFSRIRTPRNLVALFTSSSAWFKHVSEMKNLTNLFVIDAQLAGADNNIQILFDAIAKHRVKVVFRRCLLMPKTEFDHHMGALNKAKAHGSSVVVEDSCVYTSEVKVQFSWGSFAPPVDEGDPIVNAVSDAVDVAKTSFFAGWSVPDATKPDQQVNFSFGRVVETPREPVPVSFSFGQIQPGAVDFSSIVAPDQEKAPVAFSFGGLVAPEPAPFVLNAGPRADERGPEPVVPGTVGFSFSFDPQK